jgi:hypothetical protein
MRPPKEDLRKPRIRMTGPDHATEPRPIWFFSRMIGERGALGLLTTGDVMRIPSIMAVAASESLTVVDTLLGSAGVPGGIPPRRVTLTGTSSLALSSGPFRCQSIGCEFPEFLVFLSDDVRYVVLVK